MGITVALDICVICASLQPLLEFSTKLEARDKNSSSMCQVLEWSNPKDLVFGALQMIVTVVLDIYFIIVSMHIWYDLKDDAKLQS